MSRNWILAFVLSLGTSSAVMGQEINFGSHQPALYGVSYRQDGNTEQAEVVAPVVAGSTDLAAELAALKQRIAELESAKAGPTDEEKEAAEKAEKEQEEFFEKLEKSIEDNGKAIEKVEDSLPGMVFHSHKSPKLQIFGRTHLDYWAIPEADSTLFPLEGGNPQDRFAFRRLRLGVKGNLTDNMFYKYEGEFAGGNNVEYRDAYIGFDHLPAFNKVIIGNHKRPYGLDHLNSSRYNVFLERPFVVEAFNQDARRLGISSNGVSENEKWNWRYGVWNQVYTQNSAGYIGDHYQLELAGRMAHTAWYDETSEGRGYAHFAISGMYGVPDGRPGSTNNAARYRTRPEARTANRWLNTDFIANADTNTLIGLESAINIGAFQFVGEYLQATVDRTGGAAPDVTFDGGYIQASYFLTGEHIPWERSTGTIGRIKPFQNFFSVRDCDGCKQRGWGAWQVATRYSTIDLTDGDIIGGVGNAWTFGLNWYWNPYARVQMNYSIGDIDRAPVGQGDYSIIGVRMMVDF